MQIAILGAGSMGAKLGALFARVGHDVVFAYSRDAARLVAVAKDAGARAATVDHAVADADVVVFAVNWPQLEPLLAQTGTLAGKTVVTCMLPMSEGNGALVLGHTTSGAEELQRRLPAAHVVAAFGTVPSELLFPAFDQRAKKSARRPQLLICGDRTTTAQAAAVQTTSTLAQAIGFDPLVIGGLDKARFTEPMTFVVAALAYDGDGPAAVGYRFDVVD